MNKVNIANVDLNLLVVFDAVLLERNTVRAAKRLGLTQPAISHALTRLRAQLGDRLFVRAPRGLIPTPKALALEKPVREILAASESVFFGSKLFEPYHATNTFRLATTDYFEKIGLPFLLQFLENNAPRTTLMSRPTGGYLPKQGLEDGEFDLAIAGFYHDVPSNFRQQKLFTDDFVAVTHAKRKVPAKLTPEFYARQRHMVISPQGDLKTASREIMRGLGYEIHYAVGVTGFLSPARILTMTDLMLTCPRRLAEAYLENFPLKIHELPFKIPAMTIVQVWHERQQDDPAHQWLRQNLKEICTKL